MAKFIAIWRQRGGCDYTIGCGVDVRLFEAVDRESSIASVVDELSQPYDPDRGTGADDELAESLRTIQIYEYVDTAIIQPSAWTEKRRQHKIAADQARREQKERAELDRLRKKYGDK